MSWGATSLFYEATLCLRLVNVGERGQSVMGAACAEAPVHAWYMIRQLTRSADEFKGHMERGHDQRFVW